MHALFLIFVTFNLNELWYMVNKTIIMFYYLK